MIFSDEGQPVGAARDQLVTTKHGNFQVSVRTAPDPVQVSEATNGRLVNIEVRVIFNELSKKKCGDIRISFLKGVKAEHLTDADMKAMRPGIQQAKHWRAKPPSSEPVVNGGEKFSWVIQGSDSPLPDKGLTILFGKVKVNSEIGSTPIVVEFIDGAKAGETAPSATFRIGKMPSGFTFHSLVAASNYIEAGHSAVLTWQMSGAADLSLGWVNSGGHGTMSVNQAKGYKPGDCRVETPRSAKGRCSG